MRCPSCGAVYGDNLEECELQAMAETQAIDETSSAPEAQSHQGGSYGRETLKSAAAQDVARGNAKQPSRLIEFPGVSRSSLPQWREELSERVREVQERRAREAALEAEEAERRGKEETAEFAPQLELLTQVEALPINPLVAAALRRIERAHAEPAYTTNPSTDTAIASAVACVCENELLPADTGQMFEVPSIEVFAIEIVAEPEGTSLEDKPSQPERTHNLAIVPSSPATTPETLGVRPKPKRVILDDLNYPALNYLDSISTTLRVEEVSDNRAPAFRRLLSAIADLIVVVFLSSPVAAAVELRDANWQDLRVIGLGAGTLVLVAFLYLTICTAFTGRTLGMRLLSLRVVDVRTGLIPTGRQSAGRALIYVASLLSAGLALIYAFIDSESRTAHDRFTRTAVIRA
jgi:uncharacterized RDD family membrane protein YckC